MHEKHIMLRQQKIINMYGITQEKPCTHLHESICLWLNYCRVKGHGTHFGHEYCWSTCNDGYLQVKWVPRPLFSEITQSHTNQLGVQCWTWVVSTVYLQVSMTKHFKLCLYLFHDFLYLISTKNFQIVNKMSNWSTSQKLCYFNRATMSTCTSTKTLLTFHNLKISLVKEHHNNYWWTLNTILFLMISAFW